MDDAFKKIKKLNSDLLHALSYVKKDDFKNFSSTKNINDFVSIKIAEALNIISDAVADNSLLRNKYKALTTLFENYAGQSGSLKKRAVTDGCNLLIEIQKNIDDDNAAPKPIGKSNPPNILINYENSRKILDTPVKFIPGVGPKLSIYLSKKGINTVADIFYFLPTKYEDQRKISKISELCVGELAVFTANIVDFTVVRYRTRKIFEMIAADDTGSIILKWFRFNNRFTKIFNRGDKILITGAVKQFSHTRELHHPDVKKLPKNAPDSLISDVDTYGIAGIMPVYSETEGLNQRTIRKIISTAIKKFLPHCFSPLDSSIAFKLNMVDIGSAVMNLHLPEKTENIGKLNSFRSQCHKRIIFDEFFYFELALALKKKGRGLQKGLKFEHAPDCISRLKKTIPFSLTAAQENVVREIAADMQSEKPMNRLIQGDVGSGKTIVALFAVYIAVKNGYQAAIMAPTEILAAQHFKSLEKFFCELGVNAAILTGSLKKKERKLTLEKIESGEIEVVIGTHAVIQKGVKMKRMGLAVIDEQHRFGVMQRTQLVKKGKAEKAQPDVLIMTATPIPRTLAITVFGDLDVSIIDQMPPGRIPVKTKVFYENQRNKVYDEVMRELKAGNQAYIVYPLVNESETLELMNATNMAEHLSEDIFTKYKVGLLHGQLKPREKEDVMRRFKGREIDILVATTVIEVGIDIPTVSIIVVEHAERFGLSQLHQLRGRVGRGDIPAKCILLAQYARSEESKRRLKVMEKTTDGFIIAEEDMAIRGPGEMLGTRQSGLPDFQVASLMRDLPILKTARDEAFSLIDDDPNLENGINRIIKKELKKRMEGKLEFASIG